jgi:hypothetical protein
MPQAEIDVKSLPEVPSDVLPRGVFPPLRYREIPESVPWRKMVGPSIILAGLAIGSGELIFWPYLTYTYGLAIIWAGIVGVATQFFINMEIERYTLLTSETSVAGFNRLWKHCGLFFLISAVVTMTWPGWVAGAARIMTWIIHPTATQEVLDSYQRIYSIGSVIVCAAALLLSPVVYRTMERIQELLIAFVFAVLLITILAVSRFDTLLIWLKSAGDFSYLKAINAADAWPTLLGAIAFAGMGGVSNMIQGHYIREKGFAMGTYAGKIVSPITGKEEIKSAEAGYFFRLTPGNLMQWNRWWQAANWEHFFSFLCLTAISIVLLSFLSYHTVYGLEGYGKGIDFIKGEADALAGQFGGFYRYLFLWMGWAILFTSQIGVIDMFARLCTDFIKWSWLRDVEAWTESRLYSALVVFLTAFAILVFGIGLRDPRTILTISAAISGCIMFVYSILLLYINRFKLPREVGMGTARTAIMAWAVVFYGIFTILTIKGTLGKLFG